MHRRDYLQYTGATLGGTALASGVASEAAAIPLPLDDLPDGPTAVAWGDADDDGRDEVAVALRTDDGPRFWVLDDEDAEFEVLFSGSDEWGDGAFATALAFGDYDDDGADELAVGRRAGGNARFFVYDDADEDFDRLLAAGRNWGRDADTTALAAGDFDDDGVDELAVGRSARTNARFFVVDVEDEDVLLRGGRNWGRGIATSALAAGDVDDDGVDELAVGRRAGGNARFFVHDDADEDFDVLFRGGREWGSDAYPTDLAFGDVDDDGFEELGVTRRARSNARFFVFEDAEVDFERVLAAGRNWGRNAYATGIDFGDVDDDGYDELVVTRRAESNARYFVHEDEDAEFELLFTDGDDWNADGYAIDAALGDMDGDDFAELAVARTGQGPRAILREDEGADFEFRGFFLFPV
ncbi:hypothetical protein EGH21_04660 [Halomicroarcula sp. F13]|uniref:VCBS repeat-containing protein n=1 Tax=Haloarcula rubra TaxID=2487747 RepID=A0AAW4PP19_9EURY|nr:hypothetical protein [Halomicroarcula rubra]MBX0322320.1 hypothetical protein [Halomicroarcula rubra]